MTSTSTNYDPFSLRLVLADTLPMQSERSVSDLTSRMREGSDDAWAEFHQRYYLALLRYATSRVRCPNDAVEIVQQTYLRIARHIKPFKNETELWRWLACVVRCAAVDHQRGVVRRATLMEKFAHWQEGQRAVNEPASKPAQNSIAQEALANLPDEDARLLRLKYYEGWSVEQLAVAAETTPKAIENRLARLRQRLREIILRIE